MATTSAALLLYRSAPGPGRLEVLLGHMGGPFWARKDDGAWSIPKGEYAAPESAADAARREFVEETGLPVPDGEWQALGEFRQSSGKRVTVFAVDASVDVAGFSPGTFTMEWPPRSGRTQEFPELDRIAWLDLDAAGRALVAGQVPVLSALRTLTTTPPSPGSRTASGTG